MKPVALLLAVGLTVAGAFAVFQRLDGGESVYLDRDGAVFVGRRRIVAGDEADLAERLRAHLERRKPWPVPLRIEVEPGAVVEDLVIVLWAIRKGGEVKDVVARCGALEETLELLPSKSYMDGLIAEIHLNLCARNEVRGHNYDRDHARKPLSEVVATGVERLEGTPLRWPDRETPEGLRACFDAIRPRIEVFNSAFSSGRPPKRGYGIVDCCPGVPVEYALRACRTLREAGAGEPEIMVVGVGYQGYPP